MRCEITVEPGFLKAELLDRQTPEETRDALAAIAAARARTRLLADSHIGSCFTALSQVELPGSSNTSESSAGRRKTQNRADGRFRRAQAVPAILSKSVRAERDQRSQPSQRTKRRSTGSKTVDGRRTGARDRIPWREKIDAGTGAAAWKGSVRIQIEASSGSFTGLRLRRGALDRERNLSVRRASRAVASAHGLPSARWSSQARVSFGDRSPEFAERPVARCAALQETPC